MQVLVLKLGELYYALATRQVLRVLPSMELTRLPRAPGFIAGIMNYHGKPVPVIALARLSAEKNADLPPAGGTAAFDTRILLVDYVSPAGVTRLLGLRAEHVIGIRHIDPADIAETGVCDANSPFLGRVVTNHQPMLQLIDLAHLLPEHVCEWLFDAIGEAAC